MPGFHQPLTDEMLRETVEAFERLNRNTTAVAKYFDLGRTTIQERLLKAAQRGIGTTEQQLDTIHGHSPAHGLTHTVPAPLILRGTSTLYDADGKPTQQWVKTKLDDRKVDEAMRAAVNGLADGMKRAKPVKKPKNALAHLCNLYTLTDCHIGMRAWKPETGNDWDLDIAERVLTSAFDYLVAASPPAKVGLVNQLGDFLHFDSLVPVTPLSGHSLDVDSRYSKVVRVATRILRYVVDKALERHEKVVVLIAEGNHDMASSVWLRHLFGLLYENEKRVEVMDSEMPYYVYPHGKTLIAFHHGHLRKNDQLPLLFAAQFPEQWGATTKRYCHVGHWHHLYEKEHPGIKVTQHPTLAARDAYAARGGWISERQITSITYHNEYGQVGTNTVVPEMLG